MNLESSPAREELIDLVRSQDDTAGHHVLWVDVDANVHISKVPDDLTPVGFQKSRPEMKLRLETFQCGNGYVGPTAAADDELIDQLFNALTRLWPDAKKAVGVEYHDQF